MAAASWKDLDARRLALRKPMSRAEMARLAGISESTITKGIKDDTRPRKEKRQVVEMVLNAREIEAEETARQMARLGHAIERSLEQ